KRHHQLLEALALRDAPPPGTPLEAEDRIPAPIEGEVSREHHRAEPHLVRLSMHEPQEPELWVKQPARMARPHGHDARVEEPVEELRLRWNGREALVTEHGEAIRRFPERLEQG